MGRNQHRLSRRHFVKAASLTAAAASTGFWTSGATAQSKSPNQSLNIACIGTANRAAANIDGLKQESIVALCDVDRNFLDRAAEQFPTARRYQDYREMIAAESQRIDAVMIGTTDHHHAPASLQAIREGLHCYCEKPLTHTVEEARRVTEAAREHGVATQLGTQIHAGENYRRVVELIQSGAIGDIADVHVWLGRGWGGTARPEGGQDPPANLSWDLWLGPAPRRPYWPGRYHPVEWRRWWDFGQGTLGDMACHYMDLAFWALKLRYPTGCEAEGPPVHPDSCPSGLTVRYQFPPREGLVATKLTWHDGDRAPKTIDGQQLPAAGVLFLGTEGKILADYGTYKLLPQEKFEDFVPPPKSIPQSMGHHAEWIHACKEGTPTTCDFSYSGPLTETVLLGNVAYRSGQPLEWDAKNLTVTNAPEADKYVRKEYRTGWDVVSAKELVTS